MSNILLAQHNHMPAEQTYRFEFGSDDKIYSISFKGSISEREVRRILEAIHNTLFEKCGEAIRSYLDSNHLIYSNFSSIEKKMRRGRTMEFAEKLIRHSSCKIMDKWIKNADVYLGVMDDLTWMEDCSVGSYCIISRVPSVHDGLYAYHAISQTFCHTSFSNEEQSHFSIRKGDGEHNLVTLDEDDNCPVLATFGCVDLLSLLINIANVTTKQQAADLANR